MSIRTLRILPAVLLAMALAASAFAGRRPSFNEMPAAVQETVQKAVPDGEVQRIYRTFNEAREKPDYYAVLNSGKKRVILWMTSEGKILSRKEGPIPAFEEKLKPPPGSILYGVFEGRIPCADCEKVKMGLTLHQNAKDHSPTTYVLQRVSVGKGNDVTVTEGKWKRIRGTKKDKKAVILRLEGNTPPEYSHFLAVGDDLLLLMDADLEPRVGDAGYSFTLSRTQ